MTYKEFNDEVIVKLNEEKAAATKEYEAGLIEAKMEYEELTQRLAMAKAEFYDMQKKAERDFMSKYRENKTAAYRDYLKKTAELRCGFKKKNMAIDAKRQLHFCERRAEIAAEQETKKGGEL